jgi:phosphoribosyl 1,2-cyclic phosphodiesterase
LRHVAIAACIDRIGNEIDYTPVWKGGAVNVQAPAVADLKQAAGGIDAPVATFWGVRGSLPVPGPQTTVFGGNTSCIEVTVPSRSGARTFVIDAGSGLRELGQSRDWTGVKRLDLLLTHLHHDHVIGLPFFKPMFIADLEINFWCGNLDGKTAEAAFNRMFSPPLFPLRLQQLPAKARFHGFRAGETLEIDRVRIRTALLEHPSGATGYRFDGPEGSLAVITDIEHRTDWPDPKVVILCRGVDTLIYDSMLDEEDYGHCKGWGHSTVAAGVLLARAAGVRRFVGFHHAPEHDDMTMADRERRLQAVWPEALMAREGMKLFCKPGR